MKKAPDITARGLVTAQDQPLNHGGQFHHENLQSRKNHFVNGMYHTIGSLHIGEDDVRHSVVGISDLRPTGKTDGESFASKSSGYHLAFCQVACLHSCTSNYVVLKHCLKRSNRDVTKSNGRLSFWGKFH